MPGETQQFLLDGSLQALKEAKGFMEKGRREGFQSERLVELLQTHSTDQNSEGVEFMETLCQRLSEDLRETSSGDLSFDYLIKLSWKMTALSLIEVIIKLEGSGANDAVDAYSEAYEFLDLLDNPAGTDKRFLPEKFVRAADKQFILIKEQLDGSKGHTRRMTGTKEEAEQKVRELQEDAARLVSFYPNDSVDWCAIAKNNTLDKVCTIILENDTSLQTAQYTEMTNKVRTILADMLAIALKEKVGIELVNKCREWAVMLEDEKIKASVYIAGKLSGVIDKLNEVMQVVEF